MAARGKNKSRNQLRGDGTTNAKWFANRKGRSRKARKEQKRARRQNR